MIELTGKYTNAQILTDNVESKALGQILNLCNHKLFKDNQIVIMPDVHVGKSTVVGLSCRRLTNAIPSLLGPDIGCGLLVARIKGKTLNDYAKLDKIIRNEIPAGAEHRKTESNHIWCETEKAIHDVCQELQLDDNNYLKTIGTLGGGNHFISIEKGQMGTYLLVHTGSRNFGQAINLYFSKLALQDNPYAQTGELKQLSYLNEEHTKQYERAVKAAILHAENNRQVIAQTICKQMNWKMNLVWDIPHNYIDEKYIRKGATEILPGDLSFIPINMADGTLMVRGKFFQSSIQELRYIQRNYTLPHGAGRIMSREQAKCLDMKEYKNKMKDIYSSCVKINTLDESPMAYKPLEQIKESIESICEIVDHLKPVYNYKAN